MGVFCGCELGVEGDGDEGICGSVAKIVFYRDFCGLWGDAVEVGHDQFPCFAGGEGAFGFGYGILLKGDFLAGMGTGVLDDAAQGASGGFLFLGEIVGFIKEAKGLIEGGSTQGAEAGVLDVGSEGKGGGRVLCRVSVVKGRGKGRSVPPQKQIGIGLIETAEVDVPAHVEGRIGA